MFHTGQLDPDEFWAMMDDGDDVVRETATRTPPYTVDGWDGPALVSE